MNAKEKLHSESGSIAKEIDGSPEVAFFQHLCLPIKTRPRKHITKIR